MRLMICPRSGVPLFREAPVTHFVSLIDPEDREKPIQPPKSTAHQLRLIFNDLDDIEMHLPMFARFIPPEEEHVARLVAFGRAMESLTDWGLLVHCEAGISRSSASAITVITAAGYPPATAFRMVRQACPEMLPNRRILRMADDMMQREGALFRMADTHRRKAFLRAGYEDPTQVRHREALEAAEQEKMGQTFGPHKFAQRLSHSAPRQPILPSHSASSLR